MRILHVAEATFAGVGRHVVDLVRAQADAGHEVVVLYGTVRESDRFRRARERVGNAQWRPMAVSRRPDKGDLKALQTVRALARGFRPDIVHGHSTKGGMLARSVPGGQWKVVYTPHAVYSMNPELGRRARTGVDMIERKLAQRTDVVIAVSPEEETHLRMMNIDPSKVRMIPNGIPPITKANSDTVRRALNVRPGGPVIGFVGRLDAQKAPHALLDIFKRVAVARPHVEFLVVGDGPMRAELEQRAEVSRALAGRVHIVGEQPGPWAMAGMDVFLLPSRYEGMPYVLIEAAHLGLPMVVSKAAGSSLLQSGPATIVEYEVGDVNGMAEACIGLVDHWPGPMPSARDERYTLAGMAHLTEMAYLGHRFDITDPAPPLPRPVPPIPPVPPTPTVEVPEMDPEDYPIDGMEPQDHPIAEMEPAAAATADAATADAEQPGVVAEVDPHDEVTAPQQVIWVVR